MAVKNVTFKPNWVDSLYFPAIFRGLRITLKHIFQKKYTVQYPEERWPVPQGHRGAIRLNRDEQARVKCVACEMCATACPAECISMEAGVAPWDDREKYPVWFKIDMLRCILCGMCEEACPCGSIYLTRDWETSDNEIDNFIYGKDRLMEPEGSPLLFKE